MALLPGSPAIDAGDVSNAPATDQRGFPRDAQPDIGAYEYSSATTVTWNGGGNDGLWSNPLNWDSGAVPGATDDVYIGANAVVHFDLQGTATIQSLVNAGTLTIDASALFVNQGVTLQGGSVTVDQGGLLDASGSVDWQGGTISGDFYLHNADLSLSGSPDAAGTLLVNSSSTLTGTVGPNQTLHVLPSSSYSGSQGASLTLAGDVVNYGTLLLDAASGGTAWLDTASYTLTNACGRHHPGH